MSIRLITDENISWRLKKSLPDWEILPSNRIKSGTRLTDLMIWQFARSNNYAILTFDEDFSEIQNIYNFPPKIIWLRTGNVSTAEIAILLEKLKSDIISFLSDTSLGIFEIYL
jgi:predicted nuclease of predicted toxin-antitoxin system